MRLGRIATAKEPRFLSRLPGRGIAYGFALAIALEGKTDSEDDSRIMEGVGCRPPGRNRPKRFVLVCAGAGMERLQARLRV
jgi:hypothetical protein